uniref:Amino acid transporter transmembrane domain-containing protein n=1 Tax=Alexandrium catenella TaxID=2925 RepID=A0A7S1WTJ9_ALECA
MTSLLVVTGDALSLALESSATLAAMHSLGRTRLVLLDVCFVVLPLSWVQSPYSLRHSNGAAVFCTMLTVALLVTRGFMATGDAASPAEAAPSGSSALLALPIIMLSLACQVQVPCVYGELQERSLPRMSSALFTVGSLCFCLYSAVAVAGLVLAARSGYAIVPGNVLDCLPAGDTLALAMRVVMGVAVLLVYPMLCLPCRSTLDHLVFQGGAALPEKTLSWRLRHATETLLIVGVTTAIATANTDLASIFGFTGATAGAVISYILPPACFLKLWRHRTGPERAASSGWAVLSCLILATVTPLSLVITWRELVPA